MIVGTAGSMNERRLQIAGMVASTMLDKVTINPPDMKMIRLWARAAIVIADELIRQVEATPFDKAGNLK